MKKIFILLVVLILTVTSVLALSLPRWKTRPIKVYIPEDSERSELMRDAFLQWQERTSSAVWFNFLGYDNQDKADITVYFVEKILSAVIYLLLVVHIIK